MTLDNFKEWVKKASENTLKSSREYFQKRYIKDKKEIVLLCLDEIDCELKVRRPVAQDTLKITNDKLLKELFLV